MKRTSKEPTLNEVGNYSCDLIVVTTVKSEEGILSMERMLIVKALKTRSGLQHQAYHHFFAPLKQEIARRQIVKQIF